MFKKRIRTIILFLLISVFIAIFFSDNYISEARTEAIFNVDSYGAVADGVTDSTSAIMAAIAAAKASGQPSVIQFSSGSYLVDRKIASPKTDEMSDYAFIVDGIKNSTIQGSTSSKTTILVNNPCIGGFLIKNSTNVLLRNLTIDYVNVPYTQGTIYSVDADAGTITIDLDSDYADFDNPMFNSSVRDGTYGMSVVKDTNKDLSKFGPVAILSDSFTHIGGNRWQINVSAGYKFLISSVGLKNGTRYVQEAHRWVFPIYAKQNEGIEARDVTIYASPASASIWANNSDVTVNGMICDIKPSSDRLISINGDVIHSFGNRDGMLIENCSFYGMSDDGINIHGRAGYIWEVISDTQIMVNTATTNFYQKGDVIQIIDNVNQSIKATATVKSVTVNNPYFQTLTLDKVVNNMMSSTDLNVADKIYNTSACGQNTTIQNNTFYSHRGRHILLSSHNCTVQGNDFRISYGVWNGITFQYSADYPEGPTPYNIDIKNNTFTGVGTARENAAIQFTPGITATGELGCIIKNITIQDNTFNNMLYTAIYISGCNNVLMKNNIINVSTSRISGSTIYAEKSTGLNIDGLTGSDSNTYIKTSAVIQLANSVEPGTKGYKSGNINYTLTAPEFDRPSLLFDLTNPENSNSVSGEILNNSSNSDTSSGEFSNESSNPDTSSGEISNNSLNPDTSDKGIDLNFVIILGISALGVMGLIIFLFLKRKNDMES